MKNLFYVFSVSFLKEQFANKIFTFLTLLLLLLLQYACNTTEPPSNQTLSLKLEDVSCTEAWLQLTSTNIQIPNNITIYINNQPKKTINLTTADTLLYIDSLLPNQTYKILATMQPYNNASNELSVRTMDTTSHNFTWQTFEFGQHSSSVLYDVAIINENDIWAVGEIYMLDSLGNPDPKFYNLIKWDGTDWKPERIYFTNSQGQSFLSPMKSIFAFNNNDIWIGLDQLIHWDGNDYVEYEFSDAVFQSWVNKIWGSSSSDFYIVGNSGSIARYQNGSWTKIESGTDVNLNDVFGTPDGSIVWVSGCEDFKPTVLLKISNSTITTIFNTRDYLFINSPDHISGGIVSVWTNNNNFIYVTTWYGLYRKSIYLDPSREEYIPPSGRGRPSSLDWFGIFSRATDINNIFTSGNRGTIHHFNGVTYQTYQELKDNKVTYYGLDVKRNLAICCGQKYENGISDKAIITLIK